MASKYVLELRNYNHILSDPARNDTFTVKIEKNIQLERGKFISILGDSGCGKTTLLTLLGLLRAPDSSIPKSGDNSSSSRFVYNFLDEKGEEKQIDVFDLWHRRQNKQLETIRRKYIGFALQSGELLMAFNVRQNIEVPLHLNGITGSAAAERVDMLLEAFELQSKDKSGKALGNSLINKLSGGEFQRVVLARSIAHSPQLVLIDEPTSALNRELAIKALIQLKKMRETNGVATTVIMITHDKRLAYDFSDVIVQMAPDGNSGYIKDVLFRTPPSIEEILNAEAERKLQEAQYGQEHSEDKPEPSDEQNDKPKSNVNQKKVKLKNGHSPEKSVETKKVSESETSVETENVKEPERSVESAKDDGSTKNHENPLAPPVIPQVEIPPAGVIPKPFSDQPQNEN